MVNKESVKTNKSTFKEMLSKAKAVISDVAKQVTFTIIMLMGFWSIFYIGWIVLKLPQNTTALWLTFIHALISERLYIKWLSKRGVDDESQV